MRGFRGKLIVLLIVYFAGFATAIYTLSPVPNEQSITASDQQINFAHSLTKSDQFAKSFNTGMHRCIDFMKDLSIRTGRYIKEKIEQRKTDA